MATLLIGLTGVGENQRFQAVRSMSDASVILLVLLVGGALLLFFKKRR